MKKIGLALGGGAVLGAAHVGTLRAIDDCEIKISYITGTSIGAFVAAFFAFGKDWEQIKAIALELKWMDITRISLSRYGLLSNKKLGELIIKHIGDKNIEEAPIPLAIITTDITTGEKVVLDKGSVAQAVMASTCIPGIFEPIEMNGKMLMDGGIVENVPVPTVRKMGADYVIGVDLNAHHAFEKPSNILDVIINSFLFLMQQADKMQAQEADLLIKPNLSQFTWTDTTQVDKLIKRGYEDSKKMLEKIK